MTILNSAQYKDDPVNDTKTLVFTAGHSGRSLRSWIDSTTTPEIKRLYEIDYFSEQSGEEGFIERRIRLLEDAGDTVKFGGLFWWQGEADGLPTDDGDHLIYKADWEAKLAQLDADLGDDSWNYVMNTVGMLADPIWQRE